MPHLRFLGPTMCRLPPADGLGPGFTCLEHEDGVAPAGCCRVLAGFLALAKERSLARDRQYSAAYFRLEGRNRAEKLSRKNAARERYASNPGRENRSGPTSVDPERQRSHREEATRNAIRRLPEPERSVIRLRDLEGWTGPEVADAMGSSERTVQRQRARAQGMLKADFGHLPPA